MRLMVNGQYVEGEMELVQLGTQSRQGGSTPIYGYRVTKTVKGRKQTKEFKTYDECVEFLKLPGMEKKSDDPMRTPVQFNAWRGEPNSLGHY